MTRSLSKLKRLRRYPSLVVGLVLIAILVGMSLYAIIAIPYSEAVRLWSDPGERVGVPRLARPVWFDWFTSDRLPRTFVPGLDDEGVTVSEEIIGGGMKRLTLTVPFEYDYDDFPSDLHLTTSWTFATSAPSISVSWSRPDGEVITLTENLTVRPSHTYRIDQDEVLRAALGGVLPKEGLFAMDRTVSREELQPLHGSYSLILRSELPEDDELWNAGMIVYGKVHGWAGTDNQRRDLLLPLLWGAPIALSFGILAALAFHLGNLLLALMGRRYREREDPLFRRLTDVNIILVLLPILIAVSHFHQLRIWAILGLVIALSIALSGIMAVIKVLRAVFLPLDEVPHSGSSRAPGTLIAAVLPSFLLAVPAFVFLEVVLALFDLGDPFLPTWGKMLNDAYRASALQLGNHYWIIQPLILLMVLGIGFAMSGYALHRIFNPRLKSEN